MRDYDFDYLETDETSGSDTFIDVNELLEDDQQHQLQELRISIREKQRLIERVEKKIESDWSDLEQEKQALDSRIGELEDRKAVLKLPNRAESNRQERMNQLDSKMDSLRSEKRDLEEKTKSRVLEWERQKQEFEDELAMLESELRTEKHDFESVRDLLE